MSDEVMVFDNYIEECRAIEAIDMQIPEEERELTLYLRKIWEHDGIRFMIIEHVWAERIRNIAPVLGMGHFCGYCNLSVLVLDYNRVDVHGGITLYRSEQDGTYTYGFDCAHWNDSENPLLRDLDWLTSECERMAEQIVRIYNDEEIDRQAKV